MEYHCKITKELPLDEVMALYVQAGWMPADSSTDELRMMLDGSFCAIAAFDADEHVTGFMRVLSDGVSDAYFLDVVVDEKHRGQGIATLMVKEIRDYLRSLGITWAVGIGIPGSEHLYEGAGAKRMDGHVPFRL